jgi:hypothetical protein
MNLKSVLAACAIAVVPFLGVGSDAKAITWTFSNVGLSDGDVLNGYFTTNQDGYLASWSLTTSGPNDTFMNTTYTNGIGYYNYNVAPYSTSVTIFNNVDYSEILQITFANSIFDPTNAIIGGVPGPSYEQCYAYGSCGTDFTRYIASEIFSTRVGELTASPLPSTWTMLIAGFVGLLGFVALGGRKRNVAATAAA